MFLAYDALIIVIIIIIIYYYKSDYSHCSKMTSRRLNKKVFGSRLKTDSISVEWTVTWWCILAL